MQSYISLTSMVLNGVFVFQFSALDVNPIEYSVSPCYDITYTRNFSTTYLYVVRALYDCQQICVADFCQNISRIVDTSYKLLNLTVEPEKILMEYDARKFLLRLTHCIQRTALFIDKQNCRSLIADREIGIQAGIYFFELLSVYDRNVYHHENLTFGFSPLPEKDLSNFTAIGYPLQYQGSQRLALPEYKASTRYVSARLFPGQLEGAILEAALISSSPCTDKLAPYNTLLPDSKNSSVTEVMDAMILSNGYLNTKLRIPRDKYFLQVNGRKISQPVTPICSGNVVLHKGALKDEFSVSGGSISHIPQNLGFVSFCVEFYQEKPARELRSVSLAKLMSGGAFSGHWSVLVCAGLFAALEIVLIVCVSRASCNESRKRGQAKSTASVVV